MSTYSLPAEARRLYPFGGHTIELGSGLRMHFLDEGAGRPLLMLHGNPTWSFYYRDLVLSLRDTYRCVAPDHIGCGMSDKPADWGYTISEHAANVRELVEHLDLRDITLVVHDWGGTIGFLNALDLPDRFTRFVVFNTAVSLLQLPRWLLMLRREPIGSFATQRLNLMVRGGLLSARGRSSRFTKPVRQGYLAPYDSPANRVAIRRFVEEIPIEADHPNRALMAELAGRLHTLRDRPHLVIWGMKDPVFHRGYFDAWQKLVPTAQFHRIEDAGHWVVEEAPDRIVPLMREFLERTA